MDNPFPTYLISQEDFRFLARDIAFDESPQYDKDTHEQAATLTEQATEVTERLQLKLLPIPQSKTSDYNKPRQRTLY